ncbi:hypothetical protein Taro_001493 [Colocasia esculenta]|uniref:diacylglycerol O-acyltransferase n=1 Tax=Colocasia esculenta TaxID=4460 RepID=A0A843TJ82_COLES|nr:hypothetical protein [Colocasia esculenta]
MESRWNRGGVGLSRPDSTRFRSIHPDSTLYHGWVVVPPNRVAIGRFRSESADFAIHVLNKPNPNRNREFYKDWWNARTIEEGVAIMIAFLISAIFHEVPLVILTNYLQKKFNSNMVGNMIFWSFFSIFGQPMSVLLYYHDVMNRKVRTE